MSFAVVLVCLRLDNLKILTESYLLYSYLGFLMFVVVHFKRLGSAWISHLAELNPIW